MVPPEKDQQGPARFLYRSSGRIGSLVPHLFFAYGRSTDPLPVPADRRCRLPGTRELDSATPRDLGKPRSSSRTDFAALVSTHPFLAGFCLRANDRDRKPLLRAASLRWAIFAFSMA